MNIAKWLFVLIILSFVLSTASFAGTTSKLSNVFTLDTRTENLPPVNGWQVLSSKGNTYREDFVIDDHGKVWCFYFRSPGANQPVYLKIFKSDGYLYKSEQIIGFGSSDTVSEYNSIRAAANDSTSDVWVAIQGDDGGYFVILDSTGVVKKDSTFLGTNVHFPKIAPGKNGKMWFSWHTYDNGGPDSQGQIACYFANGTLFKNPQNMGRHTYIFNTDLAIDDSSRIWTVFEINQNNNYSTKYSIFNSDLSTYIDGNIISDNSLPFNPQRQIVSDVNDHKVFILEKNKTINQQKLHLYSLNGVHTNSIEPVRECSFLINEKKYLEVVQFNDQNILNKIYESNWYITENGNLYSSQSLFDSTYQFVNNGIAYNRNVSTLKVYAVQFDSNLTKLKFEQVSPNIPEIAVDPISFDTTKISKTFKKQKNLKVQNIGDAVLEVYNIKPQDPHFSVSETAFQITPGQSKSIIVTFAPTTTDSIVDYLIFISNDPKHDSLKVIVSGKGYEATIPKITVDQDSLIFDTIILGTAQTKYLYVYNDDLYEPLHIASINSSNNQYTCSDSLGFTLNAKKGKYVPITFKPATVGIFEGLLTINSNDTSKPHLNIKLRGTGIRYGTSQILVRPDSLDFGEVALGHQRALYLAIENKGGSTLQVNNISAADTQFSANLTNFSLSANSKYYVLITFSVKRPGEVRSSIIIDNSDSLAPRYVVPVRGVGRNSLPPAISISQDTLNFGIIPINISKTIYFWINNLGEELLYIRSIESSDNRFFTNQDSFTVEAGYPSLVSVTFSPNVKDTIKGKLTIRSNDPNKDTSSVYLIGIGRNLTAPKLVLNVQQIEFGSVATTQSVTRSFTISNEGEQLLQVTKIEMAQPNQSYGIYPASVNVPSGEYRTVYVTFSPRQLGTITGTINITSNVIPVQTISLQGTGRAPNPQQISVNTNNVNFDSVAISKSKSLYLWIQNIGESKLTIQNISTTDNSFNATMSIFSLNPGQGQYILVTFSPQLVKKYEAILNIQSDDPKTPNKAISLTGMGRQLRAQNIQLSSNSLEFGEIPITQQRVSSLTVYNTGEQDLTISDISTKKHVFSINEHEFIIAPQSYHTFNVTFNPESLITYQDTLKISSNDADSQLLKVFLTGSGRKLKDQKIAVFPERINFNYVGIGLTSSQNIQVRNDGEAELKIDSIIVNHTNFSLKGDKSFALSSGLSSWITVLFTPDHVDTFKVELTIFSNDPNASVYKVSLTGIGRERLAPNITFSPNQMNFEDVAVGRSKTMNLFVNNSGEQELTVSNAISSDDQFKANPNSFSVQPGDSQLVTIIFQPVQIGSFNASLTVMNNDPDSNLAIVPLSGSGRLLREPQLTYNPQELNFGEVFLGDSLVKQITVQNSGDLNLELSQISTDNNQFTVSHNSAQIESGQQLVLSVTYFPKDTLESQTSLEFRSNDPKNYYIHIPLRGKGIAHQQKIAVSSGVLEFSEIKIHSTSLKYLWVSNFGDTSLTVSNILSNNAHFQPQLTSFILEQGQNRQVPVAFTPDSVKTFSGKLIIISDDPVADSIIVLVTGIGRALFDPQITVLPDSLDFGQIAINNTKTLSLTISNIGEKNLSINNIINSEAAFSPNRKAFQVTSNQSETVEFSFTPTQATAYQDLVKIINNDPKNDTVIVKLKGTGRAANPQKIAVSDTVLTFGTVPTDRTKSLSFGVYNQGEKNLEVSEITISNDRFSASEKWFIVKPGQMHYLTVTFAPVRADSISAYLTLINNDLQNRSLKVRLTGRGIVYEGPKISIHPNALNFGSTLIGGLKKLSFWVLNTSHKETLNIDNIFSSHQAFPIPTTKLSIPPSDSGAIQVVFKPQSAGSYSANLTILSNDKYLSSLYVSVYGYGVIENVGQNYLAYHGWKANGYAPFGTYFSPRPHTDDVLSDGPDRAWFVKDIYISQNPDSAMMKLCFDDEIQLFVNGTYILTVTSTQPFYWNYIQNLKPYLKVGRNRIAILVWNKVELQGGFDCELIIDGESIIKRGDEYWTHPDATWWYYGKNGERLQTPPVDSLQHRFWFSGEYGLAGTDSISANWAFEPSGSDTIYDLSPYGQQAVLHNIIWVRGVIGQAMQFSGQDSSYVELHTNINNIPQTIELWFNCYGARQYVQNIITNKGKAQNGLGLFITSDLKLGVYYYNGEFITNFIIKPNTWYFISTQYKFDQIMVYINNSLIGSSSYVQNNPVGSNVCFLGGNPPSADLSAFYGAIDELQIKNTASAPTAMQQVASLSIVPPDSINKKQELQLNFNIFPTPFKILSGSFEYTWGGSNIYRSKELTNPDSTFNSPLHIKVPADSITVRGLKYRISLQTNYGPVQYPQYGINVYDYAWIGVITDKEISGITLPGEIHRMISVPYPLNDYSVDAVLVDNLGVKNPYQWRLFEWDQTHSKYVAYDDSSWQRNHGFTPGKSYWLITSKPQTFDAGTGSSPENVSQRISLQPGWNMIGNPFPYPVKWADIEKTSSSISDPVYRETADSIRWVYNITRLIPWEGYFVWNGDNVERSLIIPPIEASGAPLQKQHTMAHHYLEKYPDISLLIAADVRCGKFVDSDNLFGVAKDASNGYDEYDLPEAPVIGDYVSLWIDNGDWEKYAGAYTVDIRKSGADGYAWNMMLDYTLTKPTNLIDIRFLQITDLPESWLIYLFDLSEDIAINLCEQHSISLKAIADKASLKNFKLVTGSESFVLKNSEDIPLIPLAFELFQNYPNPFNTATTIAFNLPKRMQVSVKIYNILGQLVKTLVNEEIRGGQHKIIWDGRTNQGNLISTGLYIIRLEASNHVAVKKLLLIK